jgi:hypothetical protein
VQLTLTHPPLSPQAGSERVTSEVTKDMEVGHGVRGGLLFAPSSFVDRHTHWWDAPAVQGPAARLRALVVVAIRRVNRELWRPSIEVPSVARGAGVEPATRQRDYLMVNVKQGVLRSTVGTSGGSASTNRYTVSIVVPLGVGPKK